MTQDSVLLTAFHIRRDSGKSGKRRRFLYLFQISKSAEAEVILILPSNRDKYLLSVKLG